MSPLYYILFLNYLESVFNLPMLEKQVDPPEYQAEPVTRNASRFQNPEELGDFFEGDIKLPKTRNGLVSTNFRWPNGVVPYEIQGTFPTTEKNLILNAMNMYKQYTCVSFRPKTSADRDYISITNTNTGCWSEVGRRGSKQEVNLQVPGCTTKIGTAVHELMHAVGFLHEQNRFERDNFVTINWENLKQGTENNFDKAEQGTETGFGVPYDLKSVMHYSSTAFSSNGQRTITPKDMSKVDIMGQRDGFSEGDIKKINAMYNCPQKTQVGSPSATATTTRPQNTIGGTDEKAMWELINNFYSKQG